jgi:hypothetical protein
VAGMCPGGFVRLWGYHKPPWCCCFAVPTPLISLDTKEKAHISR